MKPILVRGREKAITWVDEADYAILLQWNWYLHKAGERLCYARGRKKGTQDRLILMHRLIMDVPKGMQVDHINGDGLDNRRENLRVCTQSENLLNQWKHRSPYFYDHPGGQKKWDTKSLGIFN